jgi:sugar/nucleoside kinase (ribokinase family)
MTNIRVSATFQDVFAAASTRPCAYATLGVIMKTVKTHVAVIGYASVDQAMETDEFKVSGTTLVRRRLSKPWPGVGGIVYAARGLAEAGLEVHAVTWVGADDHGKLYTDRLVSLGVNISGVAPCGSRTPSCYLFYGPEGETVVVYDPGDFIPASLTPEQRNIIAGSDWVCLLVGPRAITVEVLDLLHDRQQLAWAVKSDPDAYSPGAVRRLLSRARVVSFNARERVFLERMLSPRPLRDCARPDALLAETHGAAGASVWQGDRRSMVTCTEIDAVDTTGAGDMFFAAATASIMVRPEDARRAAERGVAAADALLRGRLTAASA